MENLLVEYLPILIFLLLALSIAVVIPLLSLLIVPQKPDSEKLSAYECGFAAFEDATHGTKDHLVEDVPL